MTKMALFRTQGLNRIKECPDIALIIVQVWRYANKIASQGDANISGLQSLEDMSSIGASW